MRLSARLRYSLYAATAVLFGSGVLWLGLRNLAPLALQTWAGVAMRVHGAAAMAILPLMGGAAALHVTAAWRERKNQASGLVLASGLAILVLTGYCLYYVGSESLREWASIAHWALGLALPLLLAAHVSIGRASPLHEVMAPAETFSQGATTESSMRR